MCVSDALVTAIGLDVELGVALLDTPVGVASRAHPLFLEPVPSTVADESARDDADDGARE